MNELFEGSPDIEVLHSSYVVISLFNVVEINPLWREQKENDEHIELKLFLGLIGFTYAFWIIPIWFTTNFNIALLDTIPKNIDIFTSILSNWWINLIFAIPVTLTALVGVLSLNNLYREESIVDFWTNFKVEIKETLEILEREDDNYVENLNYRFAVIVLGIIALGFLAGIYYAILFYLLIYFLFFFFILIMINFIEFTSLLLTMSLLLSWIVVYTWIVMRKTNLSDPDQSTSLSPNIVSEREREIIISDDPPIVCPACRSFIPAQSKLCKVCGEEIIQSD